MGRKKLIEDNKLKQLLYEYYDYCDNDFSHFKYSKFGQYIRTNYDTNITDTLIRRNAVINECLGNLKEKSMEDNIFVTAAYKNLDVDNLLINSNSISSIKRTVSKLDSYYKNICNAYNKVVEENTKLKNKLSRQNKKVKELNSLCDENNTLTKENIRLKNEIKSLEQYIKDTIHPEIANELLKKDGLLKNTSGIIRKEVVEDVITPSSRIKNKVISNLFDDLK